MDELQKHSDMLKKKKKAGTKEIITFHLHDIRKGHSYRDEKRSAVASDLEWREDKMQNDVLGEVNWKQE